jgi:acyl-CoA thioesterase
VEKAITENSPLEEIREHFKNDQFATHAAGCYIIEARPGYAKAAFDVHDIHKNAMGNVMGGASFTLADFTVAVASNLDRAEVSSAANIQYIGLCKGKQLIATAVADKRGHTLSYYTVTIEDELGNLVAKATFTSMCVG